MKNIKLTNEEMLYLKSSTFIPREYQELLITKSSANGNKIELKISEDEADDLRDLFGEQLQMEGFDEFYDLTKEGMILEDLIDKFYCL